MIRFYEYLVTHSVVSSKPFWFNIPKALNRLMNSRQMSKKSMYKVIKYHEYLHREDDSAIEELGRSMIDNLPKSMKEAITYEMNYKLFYN